MGPKLRGIFLVLAALAFALRGSPLRAIDVAWVRILSGECEPLSWKVGEPWPERPAGFPIAPSAVLSYATLSPGEELCETELEAKALDWERSLVESRRFSRCSVFSVPNEEHSERRGVIVEVEPGAPPLFGGGPAYGSMSLPLLGGRRASLGFEAGINRSSVAYRDDSFSDLPLVLEGKLGYSNDLLERGGFSGNRLGASLGIGPRLGHISDLLFRARGSLPLDSGAGSERGVLALEAALELVDLSFLGSPCTEGSLTLSGDAYPGSKALRLLAVSELRSRPGRTTISLSSATGLSSGELPSLELFDLRSGDAYLRGPEGDIDPAASFALARIDADYALFRCAPAAWMPLAFCPFAFYEAAFAPLGGSYFAPGTGEAGRILSGFGGGLRLRFGQPINVVADLGCALGDEGEVGLVFSVLSRKTP